MIKDNMEIVSVIHYHLSKIDEVNYLNIFPSIRKMILLLTLCMLIISKHFKYLFINFILMLKLSLLKIIKIKSINTSALLTYLLMILMKTPI